MQVQAYRPAEFRRRYGKESEISSFRRSVRRKEHFSRSGLCSVASAGSAVQLSEKTLAFFRSVATLSTR